MGISPAQLAIILLIVAVLFGSKRLRGVGGDLGNAIKGFKNAMAEDQPETLQVQPKDDQLKADVNSTVAVGKD